MSVIVCSQNYWLFGGKDASCVLPQALQLGAESFEAFCACSPSASLHPD